MQLKKLWLGIILICSCGSIPEMHYYMLDRAPASLLHHDAKYPIRLGIENFKTDPLYDNERIVYRESPYEVKFYDYHRWVTPTSKMVTEQVIELFSSSKLFREVAPFPLTSNVDYLTQGTIVAFEEWDENDNWYGNVKIFFQLLKASDNSLVWQGLIGKKTLVTTKQPLALVRALDQSLKSCIAEALAEIDRSLIVTVDR